MNCRHCDDKTAMYSFDQILQGIGDESARPPAGFNRGKGSSSVNITPPGDGDEHIPLLYHMFIPVILIFVYHASLVVSFLF